MRTFATGRLAKIAFLHFPGHRGQLRRIERACPGAKSATNAHAGVDQNYSIIATLADCTDRARGLAGRITAMHAGHGHIHCLDIRKLTAFHLDHFTPSRANFNLVPGLAGDLTSVAFDAKFGCEIESMLHVSAPNSGRAHPDLAFVVAIGAGYAIGMNFHQIVGMGTFAFGN